MKKLLLGSLVLLMFTSSIVVFNISCNKELDAQPNQSNCPNTATVIFTINFPSDAPPPLNHLGDNGIYLLGGSGDKIIEGRDTIYPTYFGYSQSFHNVGSAPQKVFTFTNVVPADKYFYEITIFDVNRRVIAKGAHARNLYFEGGKTYNFTINSSDFK